MKSMRQPLFIFTLSLAGLLMSACKQRLSEGSSVAGFTFDSNQPLDMFAPLTDGELDHSLVFKDKPLIVKFTVSQPGFGVISVGTSARKPQAVPVTTAPEAYLLRVGQEASPLVSGPIPSDGNNDFDGEMRYFLENGDYYLVVDHHGLMKDTHKMSFTISESFPDNTTDDESVEISKILNAGESIDFDLKGLGGTAEIDIDATILESIPTVVASGQLPPCKLAMKIFFDENGANAAPAELDISGVAKPDDFGCRFTSEGGILKAAKKKHNWKFSPQGFTGNVFVTASVSMSDAGSQSGAPLGVVPVTLDNSEEQAGGLAPNTIVGFDFDSNNDQAKFEVSASIHRLINSTLGLSPISKFEARLVAPDGTVVIKKELTGSGLNFEGVLPAVMGKGVYRLEYLFPPEITKDDSISIRVWVEKAKLIVPDHIVPISSFTDGAPMALPPPNVYTVDLQGSVSPSTFTPAAPMQKFAARTLLESMEKIRNTFQTATERGVTQTASNYVDEGTIESCLTNVAEHWSDLMIHYYCQYGRARSCYTGNLRSLIEDIKDDKTLSDPQKLAKLQTIRDTSFNTCAATAAKDQEWAWIMANQATEFRYVMDSQTFAYDFAEQQKIINEFYRVKNPNSKSECKQKRPKRNIDKTDGTHCRLDKEFRVAMKSVGR